MSNPIIRVLINAIHAKSGGGATYINNMLPLLCRNDSLEVHVALGHGQTAIVADAVKATVHRIAGSGGLVKTALFEQWHVPRLARRIGADVVFSPANYGPILAVNSVLLLRNAMGVGLLERRWRQRMYWAAVYGATLASALTAKRVIAVSNFAAQSGGRMIASVCRSKLKIVSHGVSPQFRPPGPNVERSNFLLCVSDLYLQKNILGLLDALAVLKASGVHVPLKIAGAPVDGDYTQSVERRITELDLSDQVTLLGGVDTQALVDLYQSCRAFVFPSFVETFGNPLVEAMACGAPIVTSDAAAMPEVAGDAAVFVNPHDTRQLAAALEQVMTDADLRSSLSTKALARAALFSWDRTAAQTVDVLLAAARR